MITSNTVATLQHIRQVGRAIRRPRLGLNCVEPVLVWVAVCMTTGSGKSTLCKFLRNLVKKARTRCAESNEASWLSYDQSFEKLGELMECNHGKLLGLYDELAMFLAQTNVCRGRSVTDSQQVSRCMDRISGCAELVSHCMHYSCLRLAHTSFTCKMLFFHSIR